MGYWNNMAARRQALCSLYASQMFFVAGAGAGFTIFLLAQLEQDFPELKGNISLSSWIVSSSQMFSPIGSVMETLLIDKIGRVNTMKIVYTLHLTGWLVIAFCTHIYAIIVGRIVLSVAIGMTISSMVYIMETAEGRRSQAMVSVVSTFFISAMVLGSLVTFCIRWKLTAFVFAFYTFIVLVVTCFYVNETPAWYMRKGEKIRGARYLAWLRDWSVSRAEQELEIIAQKEKQMEADKSVMWRELFSKPAMKPFALVLFMCIFNYTSGMEAPTSYPKLYYAQINQEDRFDISILAVIPAISQLITSAILPFLAAYVDKIALMALSCATMALTQIFSVVYGMYPNTISPLVPVISLGFYGGMYCVRLTVFWMIIMNLYPPSVRGTLSCATNVVAGILTFLTLKVFPFALLEYKFVGLSSYYFAASMVLLLVTISFSAFIRNSNKEIVRPKEKPVPSLTLA